MLMRGRKVIEPFHEAMAANHDKRLIFSHIIGFPRSVLLIVFVAFVSRPITSHHTRKVCCLLNCILLFHSVL